MPHMVSIPTKGTLTKRKLLNLLRDISEDAPIRIVIPVDSAIRAAEIASHAGDQDAHFSLAPTAEFGTHTGCTLFAYCPD